MLRIGTVKYGLHLLTETGVSYNLLGACDALGWEEGEGELALRISVTLFNGKVKGVPLEQLAKPGCVLVVLADLGDGEREVARGSIQEWNPDDSSSSNTLALTAYDELFPLSKSQDNRYVTAGTGTKTALLAIFDDWKIPQGDYRGPDIPNPKTAYKNAMVADIALDLLKTAKKQGQGDYLIRMEQGKVSVLPQGSNETVWHFEEDVLESTGHSSSIAELVTRVKVTGTEDKDGRAPVEAVLDGRTEFGIRQKLVTRSKNDSLSTAKAEAQTILDEAGKPVESISLQAPDIPTLRKGDKIHAQTRRINGYCLVKSVRHSVANKSMSLSVTPIAQEQGVAATADGAAPAAQTFQKGDQVILDGPVYNDSYGGGKGKVFSGHRGTITLQVDASRPCPYHVGTIGWVRPETLKKG